MQRQWPALPESNTESLALWARQITRLLTEGVIANSGQFAEFSREVLGAARTYYVRTDGSDSNAGDANTAAGAFLTIQKALDIVYGTLDLAGNDVLIQLADGTYAPFLVDAPQVGAGMVTVQGNAGTPANVIISSASLTAQNGCVDVRNYAVLTVKDMTVTTTVGGSGIVAQAGGVVFFQNFRFGAVFEYHMFAVRGSVIQATGNYAVTGGAQRHISVSSVSEIRVQSRTITITGTPAFSDAFIQAEIEGVAVVNANTWSGSATGKRFNATANAYIRGSTTLTEFPGNVAGTVDTEGVHPGLVDYVTDAQVRSAFAGRFVVTADKLESAAASVALTDAATVAVDWDAAINFTLTVTANRIIGNPTNGQPGTWRTILVQGNDATDRVITFDTQYLGEVPTIIDADSGRKYLLMIYCVSASHFVVSAKRAQG